MTQAGSRSLTETTTELDVSEMSYPASFILDTETVRNLCNSHIGRQDVSSGVSALLQELQKQLPPDFKVGDIVRGWSQRLNTPTFKMLMRWQIKHIENSTALVVLLDMDISDFFDTMPLHSLEMVEPGE